MSVTFTILLFSFSIAVVFGAVAHRADFCTMGAVSDWVNIGSKNRLRAWMLSAWTALLGTLLLETFGLVSLEITRPFYRMPDFSWLRYLLGGFMFGVGMVLAGGCASKTLTRLGAGNVKSLVVAIVIGACAWLMTKTAFYEYAFHPWVSATIIDLRQYGINSQELSSFLPLSPVYGRLLIGGLILALAGWWLFKASDFLASRKDVIAGVVIGLCVVVAWYITGRPWTYEGEMLTWTEITAWSTNPSTGVGVQSYTFVNPLGEALYFLTQPTDSTLFTFGIAAVLGIIMGGFLSALFSGNFRLEWFKTWQDFLAHLVGATLMGLGGILATGCTIGQGVAGISTLALGAFLTLGAIIFGSALTMKILYYRMLDESLPGALYHSLADFHLLPKTNS